MVKKRGKLDNEKAAPSSFLSDAEILESRVLQQKIDRAHLVSEVHKVGMLVLSWKLIQIMEPSTSLTDLAVAPSVASFVTLTLFLPKAWPLWRSVWFVIIAAFFLWQMVFVPSLVHRAIMGSVGLLTLASTPLHGEYQKNIPTASVEFVARIAIILHVSGVIFFCWPIYSSHSSTLLLTFASLLFVAFFGAGPELVAAVIAGFVFVCIMVFQCVFTAGLDATNLLILHAFNEVLYIALFLPIFDKDPQANPFYRYAGRSLTALKKMLSNPIKGFGDDD